MQTGTGQTGMQTFNQGLANAYFQKLITLDMALSRSSNPDELQDMFNRGVSSPAGGMKRTARRVRKTLGRGSKRLRDNDITVQVVAPEVVQEE